ncbi:hypothetical protein BBP40_006178 [Aspergillus hancockii]|nr:hypothetical protein BBP40_006178 [Aspergillus hancockii]
MPQQISAIPRSEPPRTPSPQFMNLPPELHLLIANLLIFPDLIHLKLTCSYFSDIIPPLSHYELLQAELSDFALARDIYTCRYCLRLRPAAKFADRMLRRRRGRYGRDAEKRFCVECGLMPRSGTASGNPRITAAAITGTTLINSPKPANSGGILAFTNAPAPSKIAKVFKYRKNPGEVGAHEDSSRLSDISSFVHLQANRGLT